MPSKARKPRKTLWHRAKTGESGFLTAKSHPLVNGGCSMGRFVEGLVISRCMWNWERLKNSRDTLIVQTASMT
jgi:hypothetical protein